MNRNDLIAFVDESGTHGGSDLTVVAGWVGYADRWAVFEPRWKSLLLRNGLRYIHSTDLRQGKRQFKDKQKWPAHRRAALAQEAGQLAHDHALFSLSVLLKNQDYDVFYVGGDKSLRRHRDVTDSKYGVCVRIFLSMLAELVERYGAGHEPVTVILESGAKNQGAAQSILGDMYNIATDRARFISRRIVYALKEQSPGVQAADLLAYPVYVLERDGRADVRDLQAGFPDVLFYDRVTNFRAPISPETLKDIKTGQIAMGGLRRRFGRHWVQLEGFAKGWRAEPLRSVEGFVLTPRLSSQSPQREGEPHPEIPEPAHFVHLECA